MSNSRHYNADYYDLFTTLKDDIDFYQQMVGSTQEVLELGCGTGRVSIPLAPSAIRYVGVDIDTAMLEKARKKDSNGQVQFIMGDISTLELNCSFDLLLAPFRVLQCLKDMEQVNGFFDVVRRHLRRGGKAIVNGFKPLYSKEEIAEKWPREHETDCGEVILPNGDLLKCSDTRRRIDAKEQVLYPEIIYRLYREGELIHTHVNPLCMRYWYPDQFDSMIRNFGFAVTDRWGGYKGEVYGEGSELVIGFHHQ